MKLSLSDYKKILKFYKLSIPKKSKNIKKKADKIIAKKFCSCIKKVQQKFKKEGIAIGICTNSVINKKGYKRGKFRCKKRRTVKLQKGGKRRKKKTRKKRGGAPKFLCGPDIDFVPEVHFNELESILKHLKDATTDTALEEIVDELPSIRRDKKSGKCIGCKKLIDELVKNTMPSFVGGKILPIKDDDILWLQQFTGVHKGRMCTIMGGRHKKKTRKKRGGEYYDDEGYCVMYEKDELVGKKGEHLQKQKYKIYIDGEKKWMTWEEYLAEERIINEINLKSQQCQRQTMMNTISEEDDISAPCIVIYPITGKKFVRFKGGKKKRKTRKKRGSMKKSSNNNTKKSKKPNLKVDTKMQENFKDTIAYSPHNQKNLENPLIRKNEGNLPVTSVLGDASDKDPFRD